jgi:hypothetical protein
MPLVEAIEVAELDAPTAALVRQELFRAWLDEKLNGLHLASPLLDEL